MLAVNASSTSHAPARPTRGRPGRGNCGVCGHEQRDLIELEMISRISRRTIAERYGLHPDQIKRHATNHLSASAMAALASAAVPTAADAAALAEREGQSLLASLLGCRARLSRYAESAAAAGEIGDATRAERGVIETLALSAKIVGAIVNRSRIEQVSITLQPSYGRLRALLLRELRQYPELAARIAQGLREIEQTDADEIMERSQPQLIEARPIEDAAHAG